MSQSNTTYYLMQDKPLDEDFSMEEPTLPEDRKKSPDWVFKITNLYTPNTDKVYLGACVKTVHDVGGNHET